MKNFFTFKGRVGRLQYFLIVLSLGVATSIIMAINYALPAYPSPALLVVFIASNILVGLACIWIGACNVVKRFHDLNRSGWNFFLLLIPIYSIYIVLLLLFKKGTTGGANKYGLDSTIKESSVLETL